MNMEPIAGVRAAHLFAFLDLLHSIGAPVDRGLRLARLPTMLVEQPDALLPSMLMKQFLNEMAHKEGISDFALRAKDFTTINQQISPAVLGPIYFAPTLKAALEAAFRLAKQEITHLNLWMTSDGAKVRVCHDYGIPLGERGLRHFELGSNVNLTRLVQKFAGPRWYPGTMAFRSTAALGPYAAEKFPNTRFLTGQKLAWIELPRSMLSLPPRAGLIAAGSAPDRSSRPQSADARALDFPGSLKAALGAYLGDGCPGINLAAEIAGTSVRTLQRELAQFGVSYSDLVQQARFDAASQLLQDSDNKVIDVAYAVGYEDPAHFTRAFRRIAGVSPREYRRNRLAQ